MDNIVVVLKVVFMYRRGAELKGRLFQLLVLMIGRIEAEIAGVDDSISVVNSVSTMMLDECRVASNCVDDVSPKLLSTVPSDCVPELPGDDADKVTPEAPVPENMPEVLSTLDSTKYVCQDAVVTVEVSENDPEDEGGRM